MNQENQNVETVSPEKNDAINKKSKPKLTPAELARMVSKGNMQLAVPIRASDKDITMLYFDFTKLTGWEFAQALDRDASGKTDAFRLTQMQALEHRGCCQGGADCCEFFQLYFPGGKRSYYELIAETAIVTRSGVGDYLQMNISLFLDFRKAISNVLGRGRDQE